MNAHARALNFEKNFDTSKLQVINNFVISTLIMGSNSYSEEVMNIIICGKNHRKEGEPTRMD